MDSGDDKAQLREKISAAVKALSPAQRSEQSSRACLLLEKQDLWRQAISILFYAPTPDEVDVWRLVQDSLAAKKVVGLPRFDPATGHYSAGRIQNVQWDLKRGKFSIRETADHCAAVPLTQFDLVLVPGVAFDFRGYRLGRGRGFYDRLLAEVNSRTCGVAFNEQIISQVPAEAHDVPMDYILTPGRWIAAMR